MNEEEKIAVISQTLSYVALCFEAGIEHVEGEKWRELLAGFAQTIREISPQHVQLFDAAFKAERQKGLQ